MQEWRRMGGVRRVRKRVAPDPWHMLSKKKKGVPPLNPLKPEKWFAYYKERFGHHGGDRGSNKESIGVEDAIDQSLKAAGGEEIGNKQQLNAERRKLLTAIRGSQYWATCSMKGDESNSIVLPVAYKRLSAGKPSSDPDQSQYSSKSTGNHRKVELFSRNLVPLRSQLQDPQRQLEPDIHITRPTSTSLLSDASSFRSPNSSAKLASSHGVLPAIRRLGAGALVQARSSHVATSVDQSPPVREDGCAGASPIMLENGKMGRDPCGRVNFPVTSNAQVKATKTKPHEYNVYGGAAMARPSCSEESSSDTSDFSVDDALSKASCHVPIADINHGVQARDYGNSCSSSGFMSPLSLQSRFLDMRFQQNDVTQFRRDHQQFDSLRNTSKKSSVEHPISVQAGLVGLFNDGNTCYLNSCLQCLAHTLPLASAVLGPYSDQIQKNGGGSRHGVPEREWASPSDLLTYAFYHIVRDLWGKPPYSIASANIFLQCVQAFAPQFTGSFQHDAQEVLRAILDGLHEALNVVKVATPYRDLYVELKPEVELADLTWKYHKSCHDSIIQGIFCGQLQSTIECSVCHRKSHCFDPFMDLSLPLPKSSNAGPLNSRESFRNSMHRQRVTLQDCLSEFGAPEQLKGSNKYYCPNCKAPRTSTKKLSLFRLPPVLVLHIKRFYGLERNSYTKDETPVYYPLKGLDLSNLMGSKARKMQGHVYDLYAVCCHMGSMGCGHYTAQCKNCDNNVWYCFNDSSVEPVQDAAVLTSSAYILFYQQRL